MQLTPEQKRAMRNTLARWRQPRLPTPLLPPEEEAKIPTCPLHGDYLQDDGSCDLCEEEGLA
ncbi:MAG: hypothetical protein GWN58_25895 [Anaerolineae bacterium]|nr:hypothetical protein [Anaerolineae bacterium]